MSSLKKFLYWCLTGLFLCFIGILNTYALESKTIYSDISGTTLQNSNKYKSLSSNGTISTNSINTTYQGKSYGMSFYFYHNMLNTNLYSVTINFMSNDYLQSRATKNNIIIYANDEMANILSIEKNVNSGNITNLTINFMVNNTSTYAYVLLGSEVAPIQITGETNFGIRSVQIGDKTAEQTDIIVNNATNNTNNIIENNNNNTQNVIDNQNENTQNIIDNQNENNQNLINEFNNNFNSTILCSNLFNPDDTISGYTGDGTGITTGNGRSTNFIEIKPNTNYYFLSGKTSGNWGAWYDSNKIYISGITGGPNTNFFSKSPNNAKYLKFTLSYQNNNPNYASNVMISENEDVYCQYGTSKKNNKIDETNDKLDDLNRNLTDTNVDTSSLNDAVGWLPAGPVDSIINLPLTMFNSLLNALGKTCTPLTVPLPYVNEDLEIPCLTSIYNRINGVNSFWSWVGAICSVLILYNYLLSLYHWVDDTLSLRENTMPGYYDDNFGGGA